jgi:hypothetical protein
LHQAGLQLSAALVSDPSLEVAHQNLAVLLRRGLVVVTAVSVVAVFPLVAGLEVEAQTGSRTWRTVSAPPSSACSCSRGLRCGGCPCRSAATSLVVLRRRALHQVIALVAVASSASTLLVAVLPRRLATDLAHTHIGVAAYFVIGVLTVRLGSAALRGAHGAAGGPSRPCGDGSATGRPDFTAYRATSCSTSGPRRPGHIPSRW